jgi:hypothetical protein
MIDVRLRDGAGRPHFSEVTKDGEDLVINTPYPPLRQQKTRPLRQYLTLDGTAGGDNDMGVDGSVTNVDFFICAPTDDDRYITALSFLVGYGTTGKPYLWADAAALTNGMRLYYLSAQGEIDIHDAIKSNQDLLRLNFGILPQDWEVRHIGALNDFGYMFTLDLTRFGLPYGIKLDRGTTQQLHMVIRDNATNADTFNVIAYGFDRFE